jgi:hypothetical protein
MDPLVGLALAEAKQEGQGFLGGVVAEVEQEEVGVHGIGIPPGQADRE